MRLPLSRAPRASRSSRPRTRRITRAAVRLAPPLAVCFGFLVSAAACHTERLSTSKPRAAASPGSRTESNAAAGSSPATRVPAASAEAPAPAAAPGPATSSSVEARRAPVVRFETEVTYVASFVHFVDSVAGTSGGKTISTYQHLWAIKNGEPQGEVALAILHFLAARDSRHAHQVCEDRSGSAGAQRSWEGVFLLRALEALDIDSFLDSIRPCLTEPEERALSSALSVLRPGFDAFWQRAHWLGRFDAAFQRFLDEGSLTSYLGEVARFMDVDPASAPPPVLCFVLLPVDGPTHAQAIGRRLLIEIRPSDTPADQVQVVAHETSHFLFELIAPDRLGALERRARAEGEDGARTWMLLQEALPTALGQGLATARLTPAGFHLSSKWYHTPAIDTFAKRIYPIVAREIDAGRTIDGPFLDEAIRAYKGAPIGD